MSGTVPKERTNNAQINGIENRDTSCGMQQLSSIRELNSKNRDFDISSSGASLALNSAISFAAAQYVPDVCTIAPPDMHCRIKQLDQIVQHDQHVRNISFGNMASRLQLCGVEAPSTANAVVTRNRTSGIAISFQADLGGDGPPLSSVMSNFTERITQPITAASTSVGNIMTNPAFQDIGSMSYLAHVLTGAPESWIDSASLTRCGLMMECNLTKDELKYDPLWGYLVSDARMHTIDRCVSVEQPVCSANLVSISIAAVTLDKYVDLRAGRRPAELTDLVFEQTNWNNDVAVVPVRMEWLHDEGIWAYIASFLTSKLWNARYVYSVEFGPGPGSAPLPPVAYRRGSGPDSRPGSGSVDSSGAPDADRRKSDPAFDERVRAQLQKDERKREADRSKALVDNALARDAQRKKEAKEMRKSGGTKASGEAAGASLESLYSNVRNPTVIPTQTVQTATVPTIPVEEEEIDRVTFYVRPYASMADVGGATRVLLVLIEATAKNTPKTISVGRLGNCALINVYSKDVVVPTECYPQIARAIGLDNSSADIALSNLMSGWNLLQTAITTEDATSRALNIVSVLSRGYFLPQLYCSDVIGGKEIKSYSYRAITEHQPMLVGTRHYRWGDSHSTATLEENLTRLHSQGVMPYCMFRCGLSTTGVGHGFGWLGNSFSISYIGFCCEATADMRLCRALGLIDRVVPPANYSHVCSMRYILSVLATNVYCFTAVAQNHLGIPWPVWAGLIPRIGHLELFVERAFDDMTHRTFSCPGMVPTALAEQVWFALAPQGMVMNYEHVCNSIVPYWFLKAYLDTILVRVNGDLGFSEFGCDDHGRRIVRNGYVSSESMEWQANVRLGSRLGRLTGSEYKVWRTSADNQVMQPAYLGVSKVSFSMMCAEQWSNRSAVCLSMSDCYETTGLVVPITDSAAIGLDQYLMWEVTPQPFGTAVCGQNIVSRSFDLYFAWLKRGTISAVPRDLGFSIRRAMERHIAGNVGDFLANRPLIRAAPVSEEEVAPIGQLVETSVSVVTSVPEQH